MELRHLRYFITVAEELHFGQAAEKLFISQPPLSRQIKELELELGVQLFLRNNKQVSLTDAGLYFKQQVDAIFTQLEEAKNIARQIDQNESGQLKIGYISSVYQPHLADVLMAMRGVFPYVTTSLFEVPTVTQIADLQQGNLDVGILRTPVHSEQLTLKTLFFDPFMVVLPASGPNINTQSELAAYVQGSPFIFFNKAFAPNYHEKLLEICARMGFKPNIVHEANNVHSILQLAEAGLGVSILPLSLRLQYSHLKLNFIGLQNIPVTTEVVLAYKKLNRNPALRWFVQNYQASGEGNQPGK